MLSLDGTTLKKRRIIPPESRKKVSTACDSCKRRKHKCSGGQPCVWCSNKGTECEFTMVDKRSLKAERMARLKESSSSASSADTVETASTETVSTEQSESVEKELRLEPRAYSDSSNLLSSARLMAHERLVESKRINDEHTVLLVEFTKRAQQAESLKLEEESRSSSSDGSHRSGKHCIPKSIELLLSQPCEVVPTEETVHTSGNADIVLLDSTGTSKWMGATGPAALLIETKLIFQLQGLKVAEEFPRSSVHDRPIEPMEKNKVGLPDRDKCMEYAVSFNINVNECAFVMDFRMLLAEVVDVALNDPDSDEKTILFLVLALGARFSQIVPSKERFLARQYFETALFSLRERGAELAGHWMVVFHYLSYFYYSSIDRQSTAWISLHSAIMYALSFGFHRTNVVNQLGSESSIMHAHKLFRSLYISDRKISLYIGRPFAICDNDWREREYAAASFREMVQLEICKMAYIVGKVTDVLYKQDTVSMRQIRSLVTDLKDWCNQLDPAFSLQSLIDQPEKDTYDLLQLHVFHLYAVNLLGRPLFMHVSKMKMQMRNDIDVEILHFHGATLKAAILCIRLVRTCIDDCYKNAFRVACDVLTPTFSSCLTICTAVLTESNESEETIAEWIGTVRVGMDILQFYSENGSLAARLFNVLKDVVGALETRDEKAEMLSPETLHSLLSFQRFFVPEIGSQAGNSPYN